MFLIRDLVELSRIVLDRRIQAAWIWKVETHLKFKLFIWKVTWDRLPIHMLLKTRGLEILMAYLACGLEDEFVEHALLRYPKVRLIWRMVGR